MQKDNFPLKEKIDRALNSIYQNSMHQKIWNSNFNISYPGNLI